MALGWRWRSMASKEPGAVPGMDLAFAISNSSADQEVAEGLEALAQAWGKSELAEMLSAPVGQKIVAGGWAPAPVGTVLGQVAWETTAEAGKPHPGWARLGLMLDFGAAPDAEVAGGRTAVEQMCAKVTYSSVPGPLPEEQAVAMMLARCSKAGDSEWVAKLSNDFPACARMCARELSRRQKMAMDEVSSPGREAREWGPRL